MTPRQRRHRDKYRRTPKSVRGAKGICWFYVDKQGLRVYARPAEIQNYVGVIPWRTIRACLRAQS